MNDDLPRHVEQKDIINIVDLGHEPDERHEQKNSDCKTQPDEFSKCCAPANMKKDRCQKQRQCDQSNLAADGQREERIFAIHGLIIAQFYLWRIVLVRYIFHHGLSAHGAATHGVKGERRAAREFPPVGQSLGHAMAKFIVIRPCDHSVEFHGKLNPC